MARGIKLLLLASVYPNPLEPTKGVFNQDLVSALARDERVARIDVVSPVSWVTELRGRRQLSDQGGWRCRTEMTDNVAVHHPRYYYSPLVLRNWYGGFYWHSVRRTLARVVADASPDVVIGYWAHPDGAAAVCLAGRIGVPSVVMVGGSDVLVVTGNPRRRRCVSRVLRSADAVVTVSRDLRSKIAELAVPRGNILMWRRGVDERFTRGDRTACRRRLGIDPDARVLLWVGRLVPVKGLEVLIDACQIARARGAAFQLRLIGDGPLRRSLEADREARGLTDVISFDGARPHEELPDWYRAANLTILPSWSEGLPNVLRESQACGTPFIASRVGGIPEIAGGADRLVPPGDAAALADAIIQSLAETSRGSAAETNEQTRPLSWAESASALIDIMRSVTASQEPAGTPVSYSVVPT